MAPLEVWYLLENAALISHCLVSSDHLFEKTWNPIFAGRLKYLYPHNFHEIS
jgi:hypothetical protein